MPQPNCQPIRYCWDAEKVKSLIRLRAELSPLFTGKRNASKYAWTVVEQELKVPLPLSKIIKKWNNLLQEYKAIKLSEEPKRREWPFFTLMDLYFSDQVNDPTLRLFSSTKTFGNDVIDDKEELQATLSAAAFGSGAMSGGSLMDISDIMHETQSDKTDADTSDEREIKFSSIINNNNISNNNNNNKSNINNNNNNSNSSSNNNKNYVYKSQHLRTPDYDDNLDYQNELESTRNEILNRANEHHNIDQYLLSWNNFHGNMCKGFHNLQKDGQMVDVTIAAGGKIFKAHKLVLSVCSPYFQKIFLDNPSTHPILFMTDVNSNYMAGLLDFMYSGQVNVKYDDLPSFLKVAEAMQIKGLHTESTNDTEEKEQSKYHYPMNRQPPSNAPSPTVNHNRLHQISSPQPPQQQQPQHLPTKYHQSQATHQLQTYQQQRIQEALFLQRHTLNLSQNNRNNIKEVLSSPKANLIEDIQNNNNSNSNSNSNSSPNNTNNNSNNNNNNNNNNSTNNNNNSINLSNNNNSNNNNNNNNSVNNNINNNNNNSTNNNNNINSTSNNNNSKYVIQQTNISNKLLDSQKYQKYYAKRKLIQQYEQEMRNQKRPRTPSSVKEDSNRNYKTSISTEDSESNLISIIKSEPDDERDNDNSNDAPLSLKHSISQNETKDTIVKSPDHIINQAVMSS